MKRRHPLVLTALFATMLSIGLLAAPASAGEATRSVGVGARTDAEDAGHSGVLRVCPGNDLALSSADGRRLDGARLLALLRNSPDRL